jgi:flavin reductase ActVB
MAALPLQITPETFRACMAQWASGVAVVTAADSAGQPQGFTASSFSSVSESPPLILVCLDREANCRQAFDECDAFAVHVLARGHEELALRFARKSADKFAGLAPAVGRGGAPLLDGTLVRLACRTAERVPAGDHLIIIGLVLAASQRAGEPLLYYQRGFHELAAAQLRRPSPPREFESAIS